MYSYSHTIHAYTPGILAYIEHVHVDIRHMYAYLDMHMHHCRTHAYISTCMHSIHAQAAYGLTGIQYLHYMCCTLSCVHTNVLYLYIYMYTHVYNIYIYIYIHICIYLHMHALPTYAHGLIKY